MIEAMVVFAASLIVSPPGDKHFPIPQENMKVCQLNARLWSLEWRNTEFLCIPNTAAEGIDWYPEVYGPRNKEEKKIDAVPVEPKPEG